MFRNKPAEIPTADKALPDRPDPMPVAPRHAVLGTPMQPPFAPHLEEAVLGLGCFWGAERVFWQLDGVHTTAVGYAGGHTAHPTYQDVCSGQTGHTEVVYVVFDPAVITYEALLRIFFEAHDPTQGMRQGNDRGTQYRSAVYTYSDAQAATASAVRDAYSEQLGKSGYGPITTELEPLKTFYYAEDYHQQYLEKNPGGYCGIGGTGVSCPVGLTASQ